jgi:hypothetical protein
MFCLKIYYGDWRNFNGYTKTVVHQWLKESCSEAVASRLRAPASIARADQ